MREPIEYLELHTPLLGLFVRPDRQSEVPQLHPHGQFSAVQKFLKSPEQLRMDLFT